MGGRPPAAGGERLDAGAQEGERGGQHRQRRRPGEQGDEDRPGGDRAQKRLRKTSSAAAAPATVSELNSTVGPVRPSARRSATRPYPAPNPAGRA
jgi:hypothetical protein